MTPDSYNLARIQRLELTVAERDARIRELENAVFTLRARLEVLEPDVVAVPV